MSYMHCNNPARCKFWSELIAKYDSDLGEVVAYCLNPVSPHRNSYTGPGDGCHAGEEGDPVDLEIPR